MKNKYYILVLLFNFTLFLQPLVAENLEASSVSEAFANGKTKLSLGYRYEHVDQEGLSKTAKASTLRTTISHETAKYNGFKAMLEIEDVQTIGNDLYNSTSNGKTNYPVVADPDGTEINQAYLSYLDIEDTVIKAGRREFILDDHRFIGNVGWRQNHQTYDGIELINNSLKDTQLLYSWNKQVNRIFGEDSDNGKFNSQIHLFNVKNSSFEDFDLTTFAYLLDLENANSLSSATYGARLNGKTNINDDLSFLYDTSYAYQTDYADNPMNISANYYNVSAGLGLDAVTATIGQEVLGSDGGISAFQTPLATLHKFNGRADKFLSTPVNGLRDTFVNVTINLNFIEGLKLTTVFHDFNADRGSDHYGTEWDFVLSKKINSTTSAMLGYFNYNAIDFATDTEKFIFGISTNFSS